VKFWKYFVRFLNVAFNTWCLWNSSQFLFAGKCWNFWRNPGIRGRI